MDCDWSRSCVSSLGVDQVFHKVKSISSFPGFVIKVHFVEGVTKSYSVKELLSQWVSFDDIVADPSLAFDVKVAPYGDGIVWNNERKIPAKDLFEKGEIVPTPFDGLIGLSDAACLWNLEELELRRAVKFKQLEMGVDACKFGHQWIIRLESMYRVYGEPDERTGPRISSDDADDTSDET